MGKKQLIEEIISEDEFDGNFDDESGDDAPVILNKKEAQAKFDKVPLKEMKEKKQKSIKKEKVRHQKEVAIRGADIFAQELPMEVVQDIKQKQEVKQKQQKDQEIIDSKRKTLDKRNKKVEKKQQKNPKHIIFQNKKTGKQYMLSNKETMEKIDPVDQKTSSFLQNHMNRLKRVPLGSII
ncbi:UNKNOWN [Stylonychia lemnae]|uniref:Uncharacterized protein n=1 Tax=Stylonychia lemnae TaxID=5949 RepID=A0A078AKR6_STYLE|nr:UNKNOWN [Stylonychia lemnae]|eukprot:CDW82804.1 UNKNOWN [Stylonychia lemnae]